MTACNDPPARIAIGDFVLDRGDERLWGTNGEVRLGNKAFMVLSRLAQEQGRLVTKDALFSSVWDGTIVSESALTSVVKELRRGLGDDPKQPRYIQSVYGRGYRLIEPVRELDGGEDGTGLHRSLETASANTVAESAAADPPLLYVPAFEDSQLVDSSPWLGDIIREELLLALSRFRDLRLVSDTSANSAPAFANTYGERDYELGIRLLSDGSTIRVFARLMRLQTKEIIWAERERLDAERPSHKIEEFIGKVAAAALPRVHNDVARHLPARTEDAYGIYLKNKLAMRSSESLAEMQMVASAWEKLIEQQPQFAHAYPPLIYLYNTDYGYTGLGATTETERRRAYALAHKAVRLEPSEPYLHTVSAWCHLWAGEGGPAREHLDQALALNPFHRDRLLEVATALMFVGELDKAAELLATCETLMPFATQAPHEESGLLHLLLGQNEKALECLRRVAHPTISSELYGLLAAADLGAPDLDLRASKWAQRVQRRWQGPEPLDLDRLISWIFYHHPFQDEARREWGLKLLKPVVGSAFRSPRHARAQALAKGLSSPSAEAAAS